MSDFAPDARPAFTKFKATGSKKIAKGFKWDAKKGELLKTPHGQLFAGEAERLTLKSAAHLVLVLKNMKPHEALCWGVSPFAHARVTVENKLPKEIRPDDANPIIARTSSIFKYPEQTGVMMVDVDPPKDGSAAPMTLDEAIDALVRCCPASASTPMVCACSSSSHIWRGDDCLRGAGGHHIYLFALDATDIGRAGKVLFKRSWLAGFGRIEIGRAGQLLVRSFLDGAVYKPERLDFGMKADCGDGVEQRQPPPEIRNEGGPFLDTRAALPDLTPTEETEFKRLVARAKKDREAEAAPIREAWAKDRARDILRERKTTPEKSPDDFKRLVDSLRSASSSLTLDADMLLRTDTGKTVTVGEIMADPEKWRGQRFGDPLEPDYGNDRRIAVLGEKGGKWGIYSHAHGGVRYALPGQRQAEPEPEMSDYQKVTENYQSDAPPTGNPFDSCLNVAELLEVEPPEMQWFAKERVPQGRGIILTGVGGVSKSTMLKQLGFAAVLGRAPWSWEFERTGKALLMLTEDTQDDAHTSLRDIADAMQLTPAEKRELASGLVIRPFAGEDSILMRKPERGRLRRSDLYAPLL
ncbi:AAA family ATPase, partial [Dehalococcoides sp. THU3]|uniref:AAA family ATPase n=1 Tax=Dehalococcoides sp. THU3 TaxID=3151601 RepID=UPI003218D9C8